MIGHVSLDTLRTRPAGSKLAIVGGFTTAGKTIVAHRLRVLAPWCVIAEADELRLAMDAQAFTPAEKRRDPEEQAVYRRLAHAHTVTLAGVMGAHILLTSHIGEGRGFAFTAPACELVHSFVRLDASDVMQMRQQRSGRAIAKEEALRWVEAAASYVVEITHHNNDLIARDRPFIGVTHLDLDWMGNHVWLRVNEDSRTSTQFYFDAISFGHPTRSNRAYITLRSGYTPWESVYDGPAEPIEGDWVTMDDAFAGLEFTYDKVSTMWHRQPLPVEVDR